MGRSNSKLLSLGLMTVLLAVSFLAAIAAPGTADGALGISATLDGADPNPDDPNGVWVMRDRSYYLFGFITGTVAVTDAGGNPVEDAFVEGTAFYYGSAANPMGIEMHSFSGTTGADGTLTFAFRHDVTVNDVGVASAAGYHEVDFTATTDTDSGNGLLKYFIRPDPAQ